MPNGVDVGQVGLADADRGDGDEQGDRSIARRLCTVAGVSASTQWKKELLDHSW